MKLIILILLCLLLPSSALAVLTLDDFDTLEQAQEYIRYVKAHLNIHDNLSPEEQAVYPSWHRKEMLEIIKGRWFEISPWEDVFIDEKLLESGVICNGKVCSNDGETWRTRE